MATAAEIRAQILKDTQSLFATASVLNTLQTIPKYTAILIEPRKHRAVKFVLQNLLDCLGPHWVIQFQHGSDKTEWAIAILRSFKPEEQLRISLKALPVDNFNNGYEYSLYVASQKFLEEIPTEQFLIAQTDSMINPNRAKDLEHFLQYDYVGAPWPWTEIVGNGGFSLRRRSLSLKALKELGPLSCAQEDQFFALAFKALGAKLPPKEVAREFSVETLFHPNPIAVHKVWDHIPTRLDDLCEVCPGLKTLASLQGVE